MRYELLEQGKNDYYLNLETAIAKNRGLNSLDELKNVTIKDTHHYSILKNLDIAVECLIGYLEKGQKIHIIVDDDLDGYSSSAIMYNYLKEIYDEEKLSWNVHNGSGKIHGIKLEELENFQYDLLIVPDGTSNDYEQYSYLNKKGKDIILLDHHEADYEFPNHHFISGDLPDNIGMTITVNNHLCDYPNKQLSGAGIVYKFCKNLDDKLDLKLADNFLDLVAIAQVGDMMNSTSLETQYYIQQGLKNIKNPFLKAIIKKQSFSMKKTNQHGIAFYVAPLINSVTRVGTYEEKCNTFKSFIDDKTMVSYTKRGTKTPQNVFLYEDMARQCVNIKSRQDRTKKKYVAEFIDTISETDKIIIIKTDENFNRGFSGLMANDIANRFNKPCLVLKEKERKDGTITLGGSSRGYEHHSIKDFKQFINDSGLAIYADGHANAAGCAFLKENMPKFLEYVDEKVNESDVVYMVDFIVPQDKFKNKIIKNISNIEDYYGQGFKEPYIAIKDYKLNTSNITINEKMTLLSWFDGDIKFVNFSNVEKIFNELTQHKQVELDLVGRVSINEWNGNTTYQFMIDNYNILSTNDTETTTKKRIAPSWF